jgi:hypothetical protein
VTHVRANLLWGDRRPSATIWGVEGSMVAIALVGPLHGFVIERQNDKSIATFGGLVGREWMTLGPPEMATPGFRAIEETLDTGKLVQYDLETEQGWGRTTVLALQTGQVMTSWKPLPPRLVIPPTLTENVEDHRVRVAQKTLWLLYRAGLLPLPPGPSLLPTRVVP